MDDHKMSAPHKKELIKTNQHCRVCGSTLYSDNGQLICVECKKSVQIEVNPSRNQVNEPNKSTPLTDELSNYRRFGC